MLIGAGIRAGGGPMRYLGANTAHTVERNTWGHGGALRNFHSGQATVIGGADISAYAGLPLGGLPPTSWSLPRKPGGMSSRFAAALVLDGTGLAVGGVNGIATAEVLIDALPASGRLIAFGIGTAGLTFGTLPAPQLDGAASIVADAAFSLAASALLGAEAAVEGSTTFALSASASALPADDTPPERTASATFTLSGALTPYAIGSMVGTTDVATELTASQVAAEVWAHVTRTLTGITAANVQQVNGQNIDGTGTELDPWGPA